MQTSTSTAITASALPTLNPANFRKHRLHQEESEWSSTNCYLDIWIELLASLDLDPIPALACALSSEFVGDQWEFLKVRTEDLEKLYGIRFGEYDTWKPLLDHLVTQLSAGNLAIVEVDSFYLPDTEGISYRIEHTKTSIAPTLLDPVERTLDYFHNGGLHRLSGEDFDHALGEKSAESIVPRPYVDLIRLAGLRRPNPTEFFGLAKEVLRSHLDRIARSEQANPVAQLTAYIVSSQGELAGLGLAHFHQFSFATTRQAGLSAMLSGEVCSWFAAAEQNPEARSLLERAAEAFLACSAASKKLQFQLARTAAGRNPDLLPTTETMNEQWSLGVSLLREWNAGDV
ncbi:hypothetical protein FHU41_002470 [Psychromicrobium silvestre]|uniref:DUF1839 domain-containing protein n=1 Tax=Psychromicrobium silvestre TaxID=1645614 RepID=A0A7Y9LV66_9MICC|nr:DUF1839 family protein [Psychromicrobium silvestre]NYE96220.1 hypothetical protein [Psychromicrobium silvestre]